MGDAVHLRVRAGLRRPHNWVQLAKFCAVGASGYVVNLCVFAACFELLGMHHLVAATAAFVVAVSNNFWWNRHWTFKARSGRAGFQAARFFAVSIVAFLFAAVMLELLVSLADMPELAAQAISIAAATPLNFVGNKMWSFALELRRAVALALGLLAALALPAAAEGAELTTPRSQTEPPRSFDRSAKQVIAIASRADKAREERRRGRLRPAAYTKGAGRWQVSFFRGKEERVQVAVDDSSGAVLEQWSGPQVAWTMARGYEGAFGRTLNAPYVWIPLCLLFLAPFVDPRRPFRLLHLDLLVMLGFGLSHVFFNRGDISASVPLAYPVLLYLLARCLLAGFRPRERREPLVPLAPASWLMVGVVFLAAFRVGLNLFDSNVIDVGYAGVIGADRIADGDGLYGDGFSKDVGHGDTYGPLTYLLYLPFEQPLPWGGSWDGLPAAHGAAIAFDLLTLGGLLLLGRRLRPGAEGRLLGVALGYAWAAYPYTAFALETNSNDTLVALFCVGAMLALTLQPARAAASGLARGAAIGAGAAAKFAPLALAPLFAAGTGVRRRRELLFFVLALAAVLAATALPFLPDGGLRELYDRTVGYQAGRPSPFGIWGQLESLHWLQTAVKGAAAALALALAFVPHRRDARQVAALGAAVLIALQLGVSHWFYLYVVWFVPFVLVTVFGALRPPAGGGPGPEPSERRAEPVAA